MNEYQADLPDTAARDHSERHIEAVRDSRVNHEVMRDDEGVALDGIASARDAATGGLADLAKDVLVKATQGGEIAIQVRDEADREIVRVSLWFEVHVLPT